ncbi:hypothetical protein [Streptomyces sp. SHP 1-2]|uniref:hypothetical protein n=1 Tax=Streptomyces sp. SHP 1-2 TaxID=2769489 RepID=UPI002237BCB9|nr:hypothetical protein [Streptomyces sp. SHP 1-2]MCW5253153.1 hypothetical protein [Streptomyces sp. SHP 1-2]
MRTHIVTTALLCTAVLAGTTACEPADSSAPGGSGGASAPADPAGSAPPKDDGRAGEDLTVPDVVGMGLQSAQDRAQETGFLALGSHDALGRGRMQAFDRNWKVCNQTPAAGTRAPSDTRLDFGAVKLREECPAKEERAPSTDDGRMPDFRGKSVKAARHALGSSASLTVDDASERGRMVLVESNWRVCAQSPAAGVAANGQPVALTAVKFGESCP